VRQPEVQKLSLAVDGAKGKVPAVADWQATIDAMQKLDAVRDGPIGSSRPPR
jgi:hypothetical protein